MKAKELRALIEGIADDQDIELCIETDEMQLWSGQIESASLQAGETGNPCVVVQCGYCTPGFVNGATVLVERLKRQPVAREQLDETITEALNDHICRCTGYVRYFEAVKDVVLSTPGLVKDGK